MSKPVMSNVRRRLLGALAAAPLALPGFGGLRADPLPPRSLSLRHLHTEERLTVTYFEAGQYLSDALAQVDRLLRDFRTGEVAPIDPALLDILHRVSEVTGRAEFEVICGYRSAATNASLADKSSGVSRNSLHLQGRAIDVRLHGYDTAKLRRASIALARGGVGYYPISDFVHLDTGRVRTWGPSA